jgi:hypothetical protein
MQASPYNLTSYNIEPIKIETEEGRMQYQKSQMDISMRADLLRKELLETLITLKFWLE